MSDIINLIAFGTFGNPNGFRQTFFTGSDELENKISTFDLNTNAIQLFADSKLYSIRKEYAGGNKTIAYSVYSHAREQSSERLGTFIGSSILFKNKIADEYKVISKLNEFHEYLLDKNLENGKILVNHSEKLSVTKPKGFDQLNSQMREINNLDSLSKTGKVLVVFCKIGTIELSQYLKDSLHLLNVYDEIYYTNSKEIAVFVHQKAIFKVIENVGDRKQLYDEIENLKIERKRKLDLSISEFEADLKRLSENKDKAINELKIEIEKIEIVHRENENKIGSSRKELVEVGDIYNSFSIRANELLVQLRNGSKLEDAKNLYVANKNQLMQGLQALKKPIYITNFEKISIKSNITTSQEPRNIENKHTFKNLQLESDDSSKLDIYKISTLVLALFWLSTLIYFLLFKT